MGKLSLQRPSWTKTPISAKVSEFHSTCFCKDAVSALYFTTSDLDLIFKSFFYRDHFLYLNTDSVSPCVGEHTAADYKGHVIL